MNSSKLKKAALITLRIAVTVAIFVVVILNFNRLTNIDIRSMINGKSAYAAVGLICGVYLLKSLVFVIPASIIYTSVGFAFPTVIAVLIDALGILVEIIVTWGLGRFLGGETVERLIKRSSKGEKILSIKDNKKSSAIFLVRFLPVFPIDFVSLLLGAIKMKFIPYVLVSFFGIMPRVILFTILGDTLYEYFPPKLIFSVAIIALLCVLVWSLIKYIIKSFKKPVFVPVSTEGKEIILDTDIGPDCDDAGAIAVMCSMLKEVNKAPLGVINCTSNKKSNGAAHALLSFCGFGDTPVGQTAREGFFEDSSVYTPAIAEKYGNNNDAEPALDLYKRLLEKAQDDSVIIVTIGMLNNISDLINACPELVKQKVHALVSMAAEYPKGHEFNVFCDAEAAKNVFDNFPRPVIVSGYEIGNMIDTGFTEKPHNADTNPVYEAYSIYGKSETPLRKSWDLTTVQFAIEGEGKHYRLSNPVRIEIDADGNNTITADKNSDRYYLNLSCSSAKVAESLNSILRGTENM